MCALSFSLIATNMHIKSPQMFQCVKRKIFYRMHTVNKWKYHIMSLQPKTYSMNQVAVLHLNVVTVFLVKIAILETDSNLLIWWITCTSACKLLELAPGRFGIPLHQTSREGKYVEWISNVEESHGFRRMPVVLLFFCAAKDTEFLRFDSDELASVASFSDSQAGKRVKCSEKIFVSNLWQSLPKKNEVSRFSKWRHMISHPNIIFQTT